MKNLNGRTIFDACMGIGLVFVIGYVFSAELLARAIPKFEPVTSLSFPQGEMWCAGGDLHAHGVLDKAKTSDGRTAELKQFSIYEWETGAIVDFTRPSGKKHLVDRPSGVQDIRLILLGHCGKKFFIRTVHVNPYTNHWDEADRVLIERKWGPYGPQATSNNVGD